MIDQPEATCRGCGYPLKGLPSGECPECGHEFDWNKRTTYRLGDEPGTLRGMYLLRKKALLRLALVLAPGLVVLLSVWFGLIDYGDWGCFLIILYPFWVLAATVCTLAVISPIGLLGTLGAMMLGIVIAFPFSLFFGVGVWGLALAIPAGLVAGLVFKHMQMNDLI